MAALFSSLLLKIAIKICSTQLFKFAAIIEKYSLEGVSKINPSDKLKYACLISALWF